jgi:hypothetical protein
MKSGLAAADLSLPLGSGLAGTVMTLAARTATGRTPVASTRVVRTAPEFPDVRGMTARLVGLLRSALGAAPLAARRSRSDLPAVA